MYEGFDFILIKCVLLMLLNLGLFYCNSVFVCLLSVFIHVDGVPPPFPYQFSFFTLSYSSSLFYLFGVNLYFSTSIFDFAMSSSGAASIVHNEINCTSFIHFSSPWRVSSLLLTSQLFPFKKKKISSCYSSC